MKAELKKMKILGYTSEDAVDARTASTDHQVWTGSISLEE